jgi:hypothetical protein
MSADGGFYTVVAQVVRTKTFDVRGGSLDKNFNPALAMRWFAGVQLFQPRNERKIRAVSGE